MIPTLGAPLYVVRKADREDLNSVLNTALEAYRVAKLKPLPDDTGAALECLALDIRHMLLLREIADLLTVLVAQSGAIPRPEPYKVTQN